MVASEADLSVAGGAAAFQEKCSCIGVEFGVVCFWLLGKKFRKTVLRLRCRAYLPARSELAQ